MEVFLKILIIAVLFVVNIFVDRLMIKELIFEELSKVKAVRVELNDEDKENIKKVIKDLLNEENDEDK